MSGGGFKSNPPPTLHHPPPLIQNQNPTLHLLIYNIIIGFFSSLSIYNPINGTILSKK
jgi:uncharacterized membrane protein (DUF106 family)